MLAETDDDELLTVRHVARKLKVDDTTVRRWVKRGIVEAVELPHSGKRTGYRIAKSTLKRIATPALCSQ